MGWSELFPEYRARVSAGQTSFTVPAFRRSDPTLVVCGSEFRTSIPGSRVGAAEPPTSKISKLANGCERFKRTAGGGEVNLGDTMAHPDLDPMRNGKRERNKGELRIHWERSSRREPRNGLWRCKRFP